MHHQQHQLSQSHQQHSSIVPTTSTQLSNLEPPPDSSISSYHSNYNSYRSSDLPTSTVSSTEPDFGSNVVSSNQPNALLINGNGTNGGGGGDTTSVSIGNGGNGNGNIHQRRGSLQLWQFLVALLDEPAAR